MEIVTAIKADKYEDIDKLLRSFQGAMQLIKYAPFPSVSAPQGLTLGGVHLTTHLRILQMIHLRA